MELRKNRSFLSLMLIRLIINFADSLFYIVAIWYTSKTLSSSYYTSLVVFLFMIPESLLIFAGPLIDRINPINIC